MLVLFTVLAKDFMQKGIKGQILALLMPAPFKLTSMHHMH